MEPETFKLLTGVIIKSRKLLGSIDSDKLMHDRQYAHDVFLKIDEKGDEELVMLALQLRERLGLMHAESSGNGAEEPRPKEKTTGKYIYGTRT